MPSAKAGVLRTTRRMLQRLLRLKDLSAHTRSMELKIDAEPGGPVDFVLSDPDVLDGMETLSRAGIRNSERQGSGSSEYVEDYPRVLRAYLIAPSGGVRSVPVSLKATAYVSTTTLVRAPQVRAMKTLLQDGPISVHAVEPLPDTATVQDMARRCSIPEPTVRDRTARMKEYPHIRGGVDLERVDPLEREGFLREAESQKGVPSSSGEILALFRNVPVEIVSKAHYLEEKRLLLYTLDSQRNPTRTRLHDLAVVRDSTAAKTHMVVHRTQFKSVSMV